MKSFRKDWIDFRLMRKNISNLLKMGYIGRDTVTEMEIEIEIDRNME